MTTDANPGTTEPTSAHESAITLSEVIAAAVEMAAELEQSVGEVDATTKRAVGQVGKLLEQASVAMETVETSLGIVRQDEEPEPEPEPEPSPPPAGGPPIDAVRRVLAKRRPTAG